MAQGLGPTICPLKMAGLMSNPAVFKIIEDGKLDKFCSCEESKCGWWVTILPDEGDDADAVEGCGISVGAQAGNDAAAAASETSESVEGIMRIVGIAAMAAAQQMGIPVPEEMQQLFIPQEEEQEA
jgi:hypothetical protein